jgi:DNA-directed RNA polymerase specialized sigma24 family protein
MLSNQELEVIFEGLTGKDTSEKIDPLTNKPVSAKSFAISMLYKAFWPIVFKKLRYQFFSGISENEVQDIVQEAFLKIYTTTSLPKSFEALPSWTCKLAQNNALDHFKKAFVINELDDFGTSGSSKDENEEDGNVASHILNMSEDDLKNYVFINRSGSIQYFNTQINRDAESCMTEAMNRFGHHHPKRNLAISMLIDGKTTGHIALALGKTVNATWVYIHECKNKLSPYIHHCLELID